MGSIKVCGIYMDNDYGISLHLLTDAPNETSPQ